MTAIESVLIRSIRVSRGLCFFPDTPRRLGIKIA
jgi:hypothetical protein